MPIAAWRRPTGPRAGGAAPQSTDQRRARLLEAMARVAGERAAAQASVAAVVARASLSKRTLYDLYETRDDCLLAAWSDVAEHVLGTTVASYMAGTDPVAGIELALDAFVGFCAGEPAIARTYLVEGPAAGPAGALRWDQHVGQLTDLAACALTAARAETPPTAPQLLIGGVCTVARTRLLANRADELARLGPELTGAVRTMVGLT